MSSPAAILYKSNGTEIASDSSGHLIVTVTVTAMAAGSPGAVAVGVSSTGVVGANSARKGLTLVNTSGAKISLSFGVPAVLYSGITLYPGGSYSMNEYSFSTAAVNAIASAGSANLGVQEFT